MKAIFRPNSPQTKERRNLLAAKRSSLHLSTPSLGKAPRGRGRTIPPLPYISTTRSRTISSPQKAKVVAGINIVVLTGHPIVSYMKKVDHGLHLIIKAKELERATTLKGKAKAKGNPKERTIDIKVEKGNNLHALLGMETEGNPIPIDGPISAIQQALLRRGKATIGTLNRAHPHKNCHLTIRFVATFATRLGI